MKFKNTWFETGTSEQQKKELRAKLISSDVVLERLSEIIMRKLVNSYDAQRSNSNYEDASWALKQADSIGTQRAYKEILDLINFKS